MQNPVYHSRARVTINLTVPWHSSEVEIADCNFNIVMGMLFRCMKSLNPAIPWGPKDFFSGVDYHTHNLEGYGQQNEQRWISPSIWFSVTLTILE